MQLSRIAIVDDHPVFASALQIWIEKFNNVNISGIYKNGQSFIDSLKKVKPEYVFMDIEMPGMNGIECSIRARETHPDLKIIVLSMCFDPHVVKQMMDIKITGYITKDTEYENLLDAIRKILNGQTYISEPAAMAYAMANMNNNSTRAKAELTRKELGSYKFSEQELKIIQHIVHGESERKISEKLFISPRTVGWHKANIMKKINVKKVTEIVAFAYRMNLVQE